MAYEFCEDEASQSVRYAEVTFSAATHGARTGDWEKPLAAVVDGLRAGRDAFGIEWRLILDHSRRRSVDRVWRALELALHYRDIVVGIGLAGDDAHPAAPFREVFDAAKAEGLASVPHAGESAGPECVREALTLLRADRIGHGIRAVDDPALVEELRDAGIPLEVCPSSNVALGLVAGLAAHPIRQLVNAGVTVTVNTDIPSTTGASISDEYENLRAALGYDDARLASLALAGVDASFAPDSLKEGLRRGIAAWLAARPASQS